jgi:hypothetical protein
VFEDGYTKIYDDEQSDRPSVVSNYFAQSVDQKILKDITSHSELLYSLKDYQRLGYHKFCTRWVPKMLTGAHNAPDFLEPSNRR